MLANQLVCDAPRDECYLGTCQQCENKDTELLDKIISLCDQNNMEDMKYERWESDGKVTRIVEKQEPVEEAVHLFIQDLVHLRSHEFLTNKQSAAYRDMKKNLQENEVMLHFEFILFFTAWYVNENLTKMIEGAVG